MRGSKSTQVSMLTLRTPEQMVPRDHPLRRVKELADQTLATLSSDFDAMYSRVGRPSVPPERLLKALLVIALHSVRSERLFCEQLQYNMLFRWFLDMGLDEEPFDATTFTQNRERLLRHEVGATFLNAVVARARAMGLMSDDHFSVDGTLIDAWASLKSFQPKGAPPKEPPDDPGNPTVNFHGEKRSNETHESKTDPEARLARKGNGKEAKLSFMGHALMENRNGLIVSLVVTAATGRAERESALAMLGERIGTKRLTVGADKGYDTRSFVDGCREMNVTPHVAARRKGSAIDARTSRHAGYAISQRTRKIIEEIWGWMKTVGGLRRTRFRGRDRTQLAAHFTATAYNLLRIARLLPA